MQHDERLVSIVQEWVQIAEEDYRSAARLLQPDPLLRSAVYHCQQSVEKALKAFLTWNQEPFPWSHNLEQLLHYCIAIDPGFTELEPAARFLTPFATVPRYPADQLALSLEDGEHGLALARQSLDFVWLRLPPYVQS